MKYDKAAVVERIEGHLEKLRAREQKTYEVKLKEYEADIAKQRTYRQAIDEFINGIQGLEVASLYDPYAFQLLQKMLKTVGEVSDGASRYRDTFVMEKIRTAAYVIPTPEKVTTGSDELAGALAVFKTGAPPEVSVNDLRAFGLMQFLKYSGTAK